MSSASARIFAKATRWFRICVSVDFRRGLFIGCLSVANGANNNHWAAHFKQNTEVAGAKTVNIVCGLEFFDVADKPMLEAGNLAGNLSLASGWKTQQLGFGLF